ncbi:ABC transporter substrate-binding protein [Streptomyces sp. NPDC003703]|uniref:ABC transporter substrate-binding protein n=1 Tax=Streptomyces sp. NPDC003283 TaxID=3364681 RepID=UPI0036940372
MDYGVNLQARLIEPLDALYAPGDAAAFRLCLVVPQSGALGLIGPSALDAAVLAAHEINAAGGIAAAPGGRGTAARARRAEGPADARPAGSGRGVRRVRDRAVPCAEHRMDLVLVDGGRAPAAVAGQVAELVGAGAVDAVAGFHSSDVHRAVEAVVSGRVPYVFTPPHEGGARLAGVACTGVGPREQLTDAVGYLTVRHQVRRWALVGNDYIWPRAVHRAARDAAAGCHAQVVLEHRVPLGQVDRALGRLVEELRAHRVQAVLVSLIGRDLVAFNRGLRHSGLDRRLVRLSGALEENGLLACGGDDTGALYSCMDSFAALADDRALALTERHRALLGPTAPVLDSYARGLYDGVHLVAALAARRALRADAALPAAVRRLLAARGPGPREAWRAAPQGPPRPALHLARADGPDLRVVASFRARGH